MPDPQRLLATLKQAAQAFRATPGRSGGVLRLPRGREVLVAGDMHGSVENFRLLLQRAALKEHPNRHLVLQELVHGPFLYPGGGDKSHQLLDLTAALKCQYPERVHYLLGNHELAQWRNQRIGKGDVDQNELFSAGVRAAYGAWAEQIYAAYLDLFAAADLLILTANRIAVCHTLPSKLYLPSFQIARLEQRELPPEEYVLGGAVHSLLWGKCLEQPHVEAFLQKLDADLLISGHIPCDTGYMVPNERQVILDAKGTPACYCLFPTDGPLSQKDLVERMGTL